ADLWKADRTHGEIFVETFADSPTFLQAKLLRHPYLVSPVTRTVVAEMLRYAVSLSGARNARARHILEGRDVLPLRVARCAERPVRSRVALREQRRDPES